MIKNRLKFLLISGFSLALHSCVPLNELEQNQEFGNYPSVKNPPANSHPIHYNRDYYRAPDGATYRKNDLYRDRNGTIYRNGSTVGKEKVFDQPGVIGHFGNENAYHPNNDGSMLPPVQFDNISNGNNNQNDSVKKRSGSSNRSNKFDDSHRTRNDNR